MSDYKRLADLGCMRWQLAGLCGVAVDGRAGQDVTRGFDDSSRSQGSELDPAAPNRYSSLSSKLNSTPFSVEITCVSPPRSADAQTREARLLQGNESRILSLTDSRVH